MRTRGGKEQKSQALEDGLAKSEALVGVHDPPRIFILPQHTASGARIVTLSNPGSGSLHRYYFCPVKGLYEFTRIAAPKGAPRSWLLGPYQTGTSVRDEDSTESKKSVVPKQERHNSPPSQRLNSENRDPPVPSSVSKGYVLDNADLFMTTPLDPMFIFLPALTAWTSNKDGSKNRLFLSADDHFDALLARSKHYEFLLKHENFRDECVRRMEAICDAVPANNETMYRLSYDKLVNELYKKAQRMSLQGLPASMEDHFIRKALEVPVMSVKREDSAVSAIDVSEPDTKVSETAEEQDGSDATEEPYKATTSVPTVASEAQSKDLASSAPEGVLQLLRLRTSFGFLLGSYVPAAIREEIRSMFRVHHLVDFTVLDKHISHVASLKSEALALRSLSNNISRKRGYDDDDALAESQAEKKRKKEEEDRKKKSESRSVRDLKKVDTSGMKKLSSFFTKAPANKATA